jgi:hypothetical protein
VNQPCLFSVFDEEDNPVQSINHHNLIEPFYVNIAINLNNSFTPKYKHEIFKYNAIVLVSKLIFSVQPCILSDSFECVNHIETFSYIEPLKRFRPPIRIGSFIEQRERQGGILSSD